MSIETSIFLFFIGIVLGSLGIYGIKQDFFKKIYGIMCIVAAIMLELIGIQLMFM